MLKDDIRYLFLFTEKERRTDSWIRRKVSMLRDFVGVELSNRTDNESRLRKYVD